MYDVREDSFLLRNALKDADPRGGLGIDIGVGTGVITDELTRRCENVIGVDIDDDAVQHCRQRFQDDPTTRIYQSDKFSDISTDHEADIITCNPPYLPSTAGEESDKAVDGGPTGVEYTEDFLDESTSYLADNGTVFFVASDKADLDKLHEYLETGWRYERLKQTRYFFETLYVYTARPTD